ncbi:MAG TPA: alpha/beta hydrolase [Longimicrobiales bacterium]|nr:alpha/beta hydrolase [Longimicrobiales bacterium]
MSGMQVAERFAEVEGRKTRVLECGGEGSVVVLVHGLGLSASCWRPHLPRLARAGFRVLAPDLPGFGRSRAPRRGYAVPDTAAWLERFAAAEELAAAAWVGHSLSCQVLLRLGRDRPDRVTALVLAAPTGQDRGWSRVGGQAIGLAVDALRERPRVVAAVTRRYFAAPIATVLTWFRARNQRPETDASSVRAPVLIVLGDEDPVVDARFARKLARRIPDVRLRVLPHAAHAVAIDPADAFSDLTAEFLRRASHRNRPPEPPPLWEAG